MKTRFCPSSRFWLPFLLLIAAFMAMPAMAQRVADAPAALAADLSAGPAPPIRSIEVKGLQRLEDQTVLSYLRVAPGDAYDQDRIDQSLKSLFATGLFSDATLQLTGDVLTVTVVENPLINRIAFEGLNAVKEEDLQKEIALKPRMAYTRTAVQKDTQRILDLYRRQGRFGAEVIPKIIKLEQNRVDLVFEVTEGEKTGIRSIRFVGNKAYDQGDLTSVISTRETAWWRLFGTSDFYDPDRLTFDRELLRRFYLDEGYADFRVLSATAELTPDRKDFFITFTVEEGERYKFGKITLTSSLKGLDPKTLEAKSLPKEGEWYSAGKIEDSIAQLIAAASQREYAFPDVNPKVTKDDKAKTISVDFEVKEGNRVFVSRIGITGNRRTLDRVVRRELLVAEADPYSLDKIKKSEQRVKDLGYFESVSIEPVPGPQPDQVDLNVKLQEKSTGELGLGAGFSTSDGFLGDFSLRERNFLGRGQDARIGFTISSRSQQLDLSFTEPYFLNRDLAAGFDVFRVTRDNQDESSFDQRNTGFSLRLGYPLSEALRHRVYYTLSNTTIDRIPTTASRFIREQQGSTISSVFGHELTYDQRDSRLQPTKGYILRFSNDIAGLGGSVSYLRTRASGTQYANLADGFVLSLTGEGGYIFGFGDRVRINDRFYLGGDTLRGFRFAGVGPRDLTAGADDALGGTVMGRGALELTMPSGLPEDLGVRTHIFSDVGYLKNPDSSPLPGEDFRDSGRIRQSVGVGISWEAPFVPIRINLAKALLKESYDETETINFSFGTKF